jgi:hypothetical protein
MVNGEQALQDKFSAGRVYQVQNNFFLNAIQFLLIFIDPQGSYNLNFAATLL